jgi:H+/Cl- antiporter ClcA
VLLGALLGDAWTLIWPGATAGSYALIGGGAVLAAAMQGPLAAIVLVIELAHHSDTLMVPLLLAVTEATIIARLLGAPSIYSARLGKHPPVTPDAGPDEPAAEAESAEQASRHAGPDPTGSALAPAVNAPDPGLRR